MIRNGTFQRILTGVLCIGVFGIFFGAPTQRLSAQSSLSVTLTPPLFQLTIGPAESWASSLKIVNNNAYDVTYYAQVMDMQPNGEDGRSKFIPIVGTSPDAPQPSFALAHWIHLKEDSVIVKAGSSQDLAFTVDIPPGAEPGGHYAAILVGTQPGGIQATGTVLKVSSFVSSLFFVRIKGDVKESARIREFVTTQQLYQSPKADFLLRFENTGNTHVRPQGDITIYNMWGRERGKVLINQDTDSAFGNVLPDSVRRFEFSWEGNSDLFDIGLYSAEVTLAYGEEGKQNVTGKTYFWVVPVVPVAISITVLVLFILVFIWLIRRYIRRALELEQQKMGRIAYSKLVPSSLVETLIEPVREGVIDLRSMAGASYSSSPNSQEKHTQSGVAPSTSTLFRKYRLFLLFLVVLLVGVVGVWYYAHRVLVPKQTFQITDVHIQAENAQRP